MKSSIITIIIITLLISSYSFGLGMEHSGPADSTPTASDLIQNYQQTMKQLESISYDYHLFRKQYDSSISSGFSM